ncbi:hypothetical protein ACMU_02175 [Actibacterium mucosum KCTC 23349]|uniref:Flagellar assembly protein FliH/Type III secretion system HrpE domain-containing protein n=1 Tax=Actibacterium mucosum KCTC 23349 TaxID=1454373 RepID=A0A037ZML0_9RHOB|nr:hypothetical protein [Actibacterium mucosum]KAJ57329.1 hypothetical protein ACMU_02175 [Actibacterium mucosum KCTC 23349]
MVTRLNLEDFTSPQDAPIVEPVDPAAVEGSEVFEKGYKAGWDDAVNAEHNVRLRVAADLEKSLRDAMFTFHEARADMLTSLAPLLDVMVDKLLPEKAQESFAQLLLEAVRRRADGLQVELQVSPENVKAVQSLFGDEVDPPDAAIVGQRHLAPGQAILRVGHSEEMIDQAAMLAEIKALFAGALNTHASQTQEENGHADPSHLAG